MRSADEGDAPRGIQQRDLWQMFYEPGFDAGMWFLLRDNDTGFAACEQKSRPWIVARRQSLEFGVLAFARSRTTMNGLWNCAHSHTSTSPTCTVRRDGWIKVYDPRTLPSDLFTPDAYSCAEPDSIIVRMISAVPNPSSFVDEA